MPLIRSITRTCYNEEMCQIRQVMASYPASSSGSRDAAKIPNISIGTTSRSTISSPSSYPCLSLSSCQPRLASDCRPKVTIHQSSSFFLPFVWFMACPSQIPEGAKRATRSKSAAQEPQDGLPKSNASAAQDGLPKSNASAVSPPSGSLKRQRDPTAVSTTPVKKERKTSRLTATPTNPRAGPMIDLDAQDSSSDDPNMLANPDAIALFAQVAVTTSPFDLDSYGRISKSSDLLPLSSGFLIPHTIADHPIPFAPPSSSTSPSNLDAKRIGGG
jgi:hypothetical protein